MVITYAPYVCHLKRESRSLCKAVNGAFRSPFMVQVKVANSVRSRRECPRRYNVPYGRRQTTVSRSHKTVWSEMTHTNCAATDIIRWECYMYKVWNKKHSLYLATLLLIKLTTLFLNLLCYVSDLWQYINSHRTVKWRKSTEHNWPPNPCYLSAERAEEG